MSSTEKCISSAATIVGLFAASSADATIQYFSGASYELSVDTPAGVGEIQAYWNIDQDVGNTYEAMLWGFSYGGQRAAKIHREATGFNILTNGSGGGHYLFSEAASITSGLAGAGVEPLFLYYSAIQGGFSDGVEGYIGFSFQPGSTVLYGWAKLTVNISNTDVLLISEWAYDDSGSVITAGDGAVVPEPAETVAGLGLLALGAAGLRRYRQKKRVA